MNAWVRCALGIAALGVECLVLLLVLYDSGTAAQLTLTWVEAVGATQYLVERENISFGVFAEIARISADTTSYADTAVLPGITYCYRLRAAGAAGYSDYSNVACGAVAAGVGSFFDDFNRPDASVLGNGWTTVAGTLMLQSGRARSAQVRMMHTAVQAGLSGGAQAVSASFISVENNLGPRFALLVRYKDPRNYYTCYRQTGGSSVLRISRVVGGVEKVLRSYALSNPAQGVFFTLGCQAEGTTLTLTLGAVKLVVSDATFSSGTVGMSVGYPVAGTGSASPHIADNFKATVQ